MANARQNLHRIGFDRHSAASPVAGLSAAEVGIDDLAANGHTRRQTVHENGESGTVGFASGQEAKHETKEEGDPAIASV
jgi:hypothetical protein